jgi:hypothetical protein
MVDALLLVHASLLTIACRSYFTPSALAYMVGCITGPFPPSDPIPVVVNDASKRKENEDIEACRPGKTKKSGGSPCRSARETRKLTMMNQQNAPNKARTNCPPRGQPLALVQETSNITNHATGSKNDSEPSFIA